jgi:tRNA uridine 5-carbamoylmethylation protein Kti12
MKPVKEIELIEEVLKQQGNRYQDPHQRLAWERGFLTGMLARYAQHDIALRLELQRKVVDR